MTTLIRNLLFFAIILANLAGCTSMNGQETIAEAEHLLTQGELTKVAKIAGYILKTKEFPLSEKAKADSVLELCDRIRKDFSLTDSMVLQQLIKYDPNVTVKDLYRLEEENKLDVRLLDGEKRYFKNCVSNLFLLDQAWMDKKYPKEESKPNSFTLFKLSHTASIIEKSDSTGKPVNPVRMRLSYTLRVHANTVPAGETVRCWMPFPRENHERQTDVSLITSDPAIHTISPETDLQRSVYLEKVAVANEPTVFHTEIEFTSMGQTFQLSPGMIRPYQKKSPLYKENTSERPPQIVFNSKIKSLTNSILQGETNPLLQVQKIYRWINDSVTWASALEYSIMPDIPGFVMEYRHGDCGMQTLLFMTLARYAGIPVKWQSGWMLHPKEVNLHDWCEVYYQGIGWVPVDQSFGLQNSPDPKIRDFYSSGIDSYRLIVNDDFSQPFTPRKRYFRSEPYDFQRGEVEWKGGNLYFDKWSWHMDVAYK